MSETSSGTSVKRYGLAAVVLLLIGGGLFVARPYLEERSEDPTPPAVAVAPDTAEPSDPPTADDGDGAETPEATPEETASADEAPKDTVAEEGPVEPSGAQAAAVETTGPETEIAQETNAASDGSDAEQTDTAEAPSDEPSTPVDSDPEGESAAEASDAEDHGATDQTASAAELAAPESPVAEIFLDVVRIAPDGEALIAGRAEPQSRLILYVDGAPLSEADVGADGGFVALFSIGLSETARIVSFGTVAGGEEYASAKEVIVAPAPAPAQVAEAPTPVPGDEGADADAAATEADGADAAGQNQALASANPADGTVPQTPAEPDATSPDAGASEDQSVSEESVAVAEQIEPEAPAAPTLLLSDGDSVRVIQSPSPTVLDEIAIDAITYDVEGDVTLSGRAGTDGFVRVYLDNAPILTTEIAEDGGWRTELPEVDTGVYTLRVDALDADGNVTARAETPFLREAAEDVQTLADDQQAGAAADLVTVQPGNTLWGIASGRYGDGMLFVRVFEANKDQIRDPDLIYPGQIFSLPE